MGRVTLLLALLLFSQLTAALTIEVTGLRNDEGDVIVMVFTEAHDGSYPTQYEKAVQAQSKPAQAGLRFRFPDLPSGRYAVRVHHDENGNGKLDKRLGLIPREGLGFSNGARPSRLGPPTFEAAAFELTTETQLRINIVYP
ncbi:DUF2141 domain-containing protein [Alkalilimnicola ehrlichii]|nr:DUF2141 domain-containing protein [Alkalilimnicola ehrlichii]